MSSSDPIAYQPGPWPCAVSGRVAVLMRVDPAHAMVPRVFEVVDASGEVDEILEALASGGLRALPDFALWSQSDDGIRLITKGSVVGSVMDAESHSSDHSLWHDSWHPGADRARLWLGQPAEAGWLPIRAGVVLAASVTIHGSLPQAPAAPTAERRVEPPAESAAPPGTGGGAPAVGAVPPGPSAAQPAAKPAAANDAQPRDFDHLFGPTQMRPDEAQEPARAPAEELPPTRVWQAPAAELAHTLPSPTTTPASQLPSPGDAENSAPVAGGMITGVPWLAGGMVDDQPPAPSHGSPQPPAAPLATAPAPGRPAPSVPSSPLGAVAQVPPQGLPPQQPVAAVPRVAVAGIDERGEMTVNRSMLRANPVVTVVAARCPQGHLSPAYAGTCRVCKMPIPAQQPFEIPRPTLGQLRLSTGGVIPVDRPVILGRNPRVPSGYRGEQPSLLQVSDPNKDVSGQHLEVSLDYWNVMVRDLGSTNGTEVILPGAMPFSLRANDPVIIEPGTRVVMAGSVSFVFEVTE